MSALPAWRVLIAIEEEPWVIKQERLDQICNILHRHIAGEKMDVDAIATQIGRPLENTGQRAEIRGNTAILHVEGPIFKRADMFTQISGATSVENLSTDLQAALDNPQVHQILLNIDSPGGQVGGMQQFADMLYESSKPVTAYVDDEAASGAYWIASAASKIYASESSFVGSIGVAASMTDKRAAQERQGLKQYTIVSSQSPNKRPDVATDAGRAQIQAMVDEYAQIFIERVAKFRNVPVAKVMRDFGQGAMIRAKAAYTVGMIDGISNFEPLVARLAARDSPRAISVFAKELPMADVPVTSTGTAPGYTITSTAPPPVLAPVPAPVAADTITPAQAATNERQRIAAILRCPEAAGRQAAAEALALDSNVDVETARNILRVSPAATPINPLATAMTAVPNPKVGTGGGADEDTADAEAARVLNFVPKNRRAG